MAGYNYSCDWRAGFVMDPSKKQRIGYIADLKLLKVADMLEEDIEVFSPFNATPKYSEVKIDDATKKATVVGVIENWSWGGGVGDPICISAYISSDNASKLKGKMKMTLDNNLVNKLGWWIATYDEENKQWFEEAYPIDPALVTGQINAPGGKDVRLVVADEPTKIGHNIDLNVYNLYIEVIPAMNSTFALHFATSAQTPYVRNWGLKVGKQAAAQFT